MLFPSPLLPQVTYLRLPQLQLLIAGALCNFLLLSRSWAGGNWCHLCGTAISSEGVSPAFLQQPGQQAQAQFLSHVAIFDDI